jgi:hypothetical protein
MPEPHFLPPVNEEKPPAAVAGGLFAMAKKGAKKRQEIAEAEEPHDGPAGNEILEGTTTLGALAKQRGVRMLDRPTASASQMAASIISRMNRPYA